MRFLFQQLRQKVEDHEDYQHCQEQVEQSVAD